MSNGLVPEGMGYVPAPSRGLGKAVQPEKVFLALTFKTVAARFVEGFCYSLLDIAISSSIMIFLDLREP
ncbi:MAG: hypothetical protein J0L96_14890 [Anaerolineae bacterium]|nr:hypothetical protein [Anaerolineae bacterium]